MKTKEELIKELRKNIADVEYLYVMVFLESDDYGNTYEPVKVDVDELDFCKDGFYYDVDWFYYHELGSTWAFEEGVLRKMRNQDYC